MLPPELQQLGEFSIVEKIGQGAMGAVYKARQTSLNRFVALKLLPPAAADDPGFLTRFKNEAMAAAGLNHTNIVQVYAAGHDAGIHYFAMEYVEGESFGSRLKRKGRIEPREAIVTAYYIAQALEYAWKRARLIHRDIKPDNIFLSHEGTVKLGDLGLAKVLGGQGVTQTGTAMGTPHYISPEQALGEREIDFRSDIYSLGCTIYHAITGTPPYRGDSAMSVMLQHISRPPPGVLAVWPECPPSVVALLEKMLRKEPGGRAESYEVLLADLLRVSEELQRPAPATSPAGANASAAASPTALREAQAQTTVVNRPERTARKTGPILAVAAVGLLAAGALWAPWKTKPADSGSAGKSAPPAAADTFPQTAELMRKPAATFSGTLPGTIWSVRDSLGDQYLFEFAPDGVLNYETRRGVRANGKWTKNGPALTIDINEGFAKLNGSLSGQQMKGDATSKSAGRWTWDAAPR